MIDTARIVRCWIATQLRRHLAHILYSVLEGPLCANSYRKLCCGLPKPNWQTACYSYILPGWCHCIWPRASYLRRRTENLANNSGAIKALLWKHSCWRAIKGRLSKECRNSEARQRRASLLVHYEGNPHKTSNFPIPSPNKLLTRIKMWVQITVFISDSNSHVVLAYTLQLWSLICLGIRQCNNCHL